MSDSQHPATESSNGLRLCPLCGMKPEAEWRHHAGHTPRYADVRAATNDVDQAVMLTDLCDYLVRRASRDVEAAGYARGRREALEEAGKDSARLDWLDTKSEAVVSTGSDGQPSLDAYAWGIYGQRYDVRTAIDADMESAARTSQPSEAPSE